MAKEKVDVRSEDEKLRQKKNNFTMTYILVGISIIAILVILLIAYLVK